MKVAVKDINNYVEYIRNFKILIKNTEAINLKVYK